MEDGKQILKYDGVTLPSGGRVRVLARRDELVGIAIRESNDRASLVRRTLGYEEGCDNIILKDTAVGAMGLPELALARSRIGTNLPAVELLASTERREKMAPHKAKKKIKKAKTLLAGFEERMRFLLYGCDSDAAARVAINECNERFIRWLKELGMRHETSGKQLDHDGWTVFYLAAALAVGRDMIIIRTPFESQTPERLVRMQDTINAFGRQEDAAGVFLASSKNCVGAHVCNRWIG